MWHSVFDRKRPTVRYVCDHVFCMPFANRSAAINILPCEQAIVRADNVQMKRENEIKRRMARGISSRCYWWLHIFPLIASQLAGIIDQVRLLFPMSTVSYRTRSIRLNTYLSLHIWWNLSLCYAFHLYKVERKV